MYLKIEFWLYKKPLQWGLFTKDLEIAVENSPWCILYDGNNIGKKICCVLVCSIVRDRNKVKKHYIPKDLREKLAEQFFIADGKYKRYCQPYGTNTDRCLIFVVEILRSESDNILNFDPDQITNWTEHASSPDLAARALNLNEKAAFTSLPNVLFDKEGKSKSKKNPIDDMLVFDDTNCTSTEVLASNSGLEKSSSNSSTSTSGSYTLEVLPLNPDKANNDNDKELSSSSSSSEYIGILKNKSDNKPVQLMFKNMQFNNADDDANLEQKPAKYVTFKFSNLSDTESVFEDANPNPNPSPSNSTIGSDLNAEDIMDFEVENLEAFLNGRSDSGNFVRLC